jgi:hypothetical protein
VALRRPGKGALGGRGTTGAGPPASRGRAGAGHSTVRSPSIAYAAVIGEYLKWAALGDDVKKGRAPLPPEDANDDFWRLVLDVRMLGSKKTGTAVQDLYFAVCELVWPGTMGGPEEPEWDAMDAFEKFQDAARADLGVPQPKRFKEMELKLPD